MRWRHCHGNIWVLKRLNDTFVNYLISFNCFGVLESQFCILLVHAVHQPLYFVQKLCWWKILRTRVNQILWLYHCLTKAKTFTSDLGYWPSVIRYYCVLIYVQLFWPQILIKLLHEIFLCATNMIKLLHETHLSGAAQGFMNTTHCIVSYFNCKPESSFTVFASALSKRLLWEVPDTVFMSQFQFSQSWLCYLFARFFLTNVQLFHSKCATFHSFWLK